MFYVAPPPAESTGTTQDVELDGSYYRLTQRWNDRAGVWMLDVADADGNALATGLPMRSGVPVTLHLRRRTGMPPGALFVFDASETADPGFTDLGGRVKLAYFTAAELTEAGL